MLLRLYVVVLTLVSMVGFIVVGITVLEMKDKLQFYAERVNNLENSGMIFDKTATGLAYCHPTWFGGNASWGEQSTRDCGNRADLKPAPLPD